MNRKQALTGIAAAAGMMVLILDSRTGLTGAREGLALCIRSVIPSLFPFFLLSAALTSSLSGAKIPVLRPLARLCGIPPGGEAIMLTGFLGGYPVGAHAVTQAYRSGHLSRPQAERMIGFCNNAGPSFLFGIVAGAFPNPKYAWALWGIYLLSAMITGILLPGRGNSPSEQSQWEKVNRDELMKRALIAMANVCGWVIIFRVILAFLNRWLFWIFPVSFQVLFSGLFELTNGCCMLAEIENIGLRFILCAGMVTFGGLCVTMQTISTMQTLSSRSYLTGKLCQTVICVLLATLTQAFFPVDQRYSIRASYLIVLFPVAVIWIARNLKNNSSNPAAVGV